ncbi:MULTISPECIES: hypothetical protein [Streptomyces]
MADSPALMFPRLKQWRGIATHYHKTSYQAAAGTLASLPMRA